MVWLTLLMSNEWFEEFEAVWSVGEVLLHAVPTGNAPRNWVIRLSYRVWSNREYFSCARYHFLGNVFEQSPLTERHASTRVSAWPGDLRNGVAEVTRYPTRMHSSINLRFLCLTTPFPRYFSIFSVSKSCAHSSNRIENETETQDAGFGSGDTPMLFLLDGLVSNAEFSFEVI